MDSPHAAGRQPLSPVTALVSRTSHFGHLWRLHGVAAATAVAVSWVLMTCGARIAHADDRAGHEGLNLPRGSLRVGAALEVGLDGPPPMGSPVSLAPDVYLGVGRRLTLGLIHSGGALGLTDSGWGFCLTGRTGGCDLAVSGTGYDGWYTFLRSRRFELAVRSRLYVAHYFRRFKLRTSLGFTGVWRAGPVALRFDPHLSFGLVNREAGNADALNVPIHVYVALGRYVALYLRTGLFGLLRSFADQYAIPLGLGVVVRPTARLRVGAQFVLRQILGPQNTYRKRDLLFYADYRFDSLF
jgi:hypothetical protein